MHNDFLFNFFIILLTSIYFFVFNDYIKDTKKDLLRYDDFIFLTKI